jgi:uncharacterized protein YsxB (DUF464 family)
MAMNLAPVNFKYSEFANLKESIGLDNSFNVGSTQEGRWAKPLMTSYMESVLYGMAIHPIVILDLESCLSYCVEDSNDWKYFKSWLDQGFKFLAIDGNNRSITIHKFFKLNKVFLLPRKSYAIQVDDGTVQSFTLDKESNTYQNLPKPLRKKYDDAVMTVHVVKKATRQEITDLFLRLNSGMPLNAQEKRNAMLTEMAEYVRDVADKYRNTVGVQIVSPKSIIRLAWDELVASCVVYHTHQNRKITINTDALDCAYVDNSKETKNISDVNVVLEDALKIISNDSNMLFKTSKFAKFNFMNWFILVCYLHKNNYKIKKGQDLLQWFVTTEIQRLLSQKVVFTNKQGYTKVYSEMNLDDAAKLEVREECIVEEFQDSDLVQEGIVVQLDKVRIYTDEQRYLIWERQGKVCPLSGKSIPIHEVLDASKWQADHIEEYSIGGDTSIENGQLVCVEAHKQKTRAFVKKMRS